MSWQNSNQASGFSPEYHPNPYEPVHPPATYQDRGVMYTNGDYSYLPGNVPTAYVEQPHSYGHDLRSNYVPGMAIQTNDFGEYSSSVPLDSLHYHEHTFPAQQLGNFDKGVKHSSRSRAQNYRFSQNSRRHNYYENSQRQYMDEDQYYYEAYYQYGYKPRGRGQRGYFNQSKSNPRGKDEYHYSGSSGNSKLGNGDGKSQWQANSGHKQNRDEADSSYGPEAAGRYQHSKQEPVMEKSNQEHMSSSKNKTYRQGTGYHRGGKKGHYENEERQPKSNEKYYQSGSKHEETTSKKPDNFEGGKTNEERSKSSVDSKDVRAKHEASHYSRVKGSQVTGRSGFYPGWAGRRSSNDKAYKFNSSVQDSAENDESQRGSLTEQLCTNKYECMVCCENIRAEASVWSCMNCYHVFHLSCIQKWAQSSINKDLKNWRCPGCQNVSTKIPSQYRCFCGSKKDPKYIRGEIPHSCGETCRRSRKGNCKHPCTILCHPGPCPPCSSMVRAACDCGKINKSVRCSTSITFKCDEVCDKPLNCSDHKCVIVCHAGPCPPCDVSKTQECFCKRATRNALCGTEEFKMIGFCCEKICGRTLDCGNHICESSCHPGDCGSCNLKPALLLTCCCGKTPLSELTSSKRDSCLDPVPTCEQICNKPMSCGSQTEPHLCDKKCHNGDCGPCNKDTLMKCECGAIEKKVPCEVAVTFNDKNPFKCQRRCGKKKTCGKHKCSDNCCVKDIHICEIVCGQKLSCGKHKCEELCHRGNCKRCLEASFEELTCYCGAEVIEPPVPCGARRPDCHKLCSRQHDCDHPVRHNCHGDEVCPPCTELTEKMCVGGHMMRKNVPCHMTNISCGYPCNKVLPCGQHKCLKACHKGNCLEENNVCNQPCTKARPACGHPCGMPCHSGECPDEACKTEIMITCPCGSRTAKAQCLAGGDLSSEIAQFQRLSVQSIVESGGQSVDMSQFTQSKKSNKRLDCDTNCAIIERNRRLALALEIKNPDMNAKLGNPTFTDFLKDFAKKNPKFALSVEKNLNELVQSSKQSLQPSRSHAFQSMNRDQRRFVHELAEFYGCQTQSYDCEPNKNVVATAYKEKCWLPNVTLTQMACKDQLQKAPPLISTFKTQGVTFTVLEKKKISVKEQPSTSRAWEDVGATAASPKPSIDYFDYTE
ncbi:transcriptional repressor NF-X1-like [Physella acuta]|uniref:transcriptional repressor NF-X1-like n=1 Tax=Physella acuta TaxID=109671 RepID=UPI0027DB9139|nr:transcriptional repressor NF-X1-like [Physella acuta]XP_059163307.1 transcriptional repressor NF-X1-like [Physella acuta]